MKSWALFQVEGSRERLIAIFRTFDDANQMRQRLKKGTDKILFLNVRVLD